MSQRYSNDAIAKKHARNRQNFLEKAKEKYGDRFDYSRMEYVTQKIIYIYIYIYIYIAWGFCWVYGNVN